MNRPKFQRSIYCRLTLVFCGLTFFMSTSFVAAAGWTRSEQKPDIVVPLLLALIVGAMGLLLVRQLHHQRLLAKSLGEQEQRYRLLADNVADVLFISDLQGRFRYVSRSVSALLGMPEEDFLGRSCIELMHEDDRAEVIRTTSAIMRFPVARSVRFRTKRQDGEFVWLEANLKIAQNPLSGEREIVGALRDVTQRKALEDELATANRRLEHLASRDSLTTLFNRRSFDLSLHEVCVRHAALSVLLIDIDHFKGYNDALGHQAGDECLRRIATAIGSIATETGGLSARYGGEEFAIILPGTAEIQALAVADSLRSRVKELEIYHPLSSQPVTISIGVATRSRISIDKVLLIRRADLALYEAKAQGRDRTISSSMLDDGRDLEMPRLVPELPHDPIEGSRDNRLTTIDERCGSLTAILSHVARTDDIA